MFVRLLKGSSCARQWLNDLRLAKHPCVKVVKLLDVWLARRCQLAGGSNSLGGAGADYSQRYLSPMCAGLGRSR